LYALASGNIDKVVMVAYHSSDKLANQDATQRSDVYYSDLGTWGDTPVNGLKVSGASDYSPSNITQNVINTLYNRNANFTFVLNTTNTSVGNAHSCKLDVSATSLNTFTSTKGIKLHVAIIENNIDYQKVYGVAAGNGQNIHNYVTRKMFPNGTGTVIGNQTNGKENKYSFNYTNDDSKQNYLNTRVVIFIQNEDTREVLDCYMSKVHPFQNSVAIEHSNPGKTGSTLLINSIHSNMISITVPENNRYSLSLYSIAGKGITTIGNPLLKKGENTVKWNASTLAKGIYCIQLKSQNSSVSAKFILQ